nr:FapA family protein [uncultured Catonella sp.]
MVYKNAFFQMLIKDTVYIKYFPPRNGGDKLNFEEFVGYMNAHSISLDYKEFSDAMSRAKEPFIFKTNTEKTYPEAEKMIINISEDSMQVVCRFIPPSTGGKIMHKEDLLKDLELNGIKFGIIEEEVDRYINNKQYCTDYIMARGKPPVNGHDAKIIYKFNTDLQAKPKENDDGTVDFYDLDIIASVSAGDELAELIKEDEGKSGIDVRGRLIRPDKVEKLRLKYGKDISLSEDGLHLISDISGHVILDNENKVKVSNIFTVKNDVDISTGDINYDGNVEVRGNVINGFKITATGDVIIGGTAEGVEITAGGQIILKRGIRGMGKGILKSGGNVIAKFLENTTVQSGGYVIADAIIYSDVSSKGDVIVNSKKGYVNGGTIRSETLIKVKNAGSEMGTKTNLEVGVDPTLLVRYKTLRSKIEETMQRMEVSSKSIELYSRKMRNGEKLSPEKLSQFKILAMEYKRDNDNVSLMQEECISIQGEIEKQDGGIIEVGNVVYPGVKVVVVDSTLYIRNEVKSVRFVRDGADVIARHLH